jgi:hypothetical protein
MQTKLTIAAIKQLCNQNPDCFFFSKDTMRFYRQAQAKYFANFLNGINYVTVAKILPGSRQVQYAFYELTETNGRYHLKYIEKLPDKIAPEKVA